MLNLAIGMGSACQNLTTLQLGTFSPILARQGIWQVFGNHIIFFFDKIKLMHIKIYNFQTSEYIKIVCSISINVFAYIFLFVCVQV